MRKRNLVFLPFLTLSLALFLSGCGPTEQEDSEFALGVKIGVAPMRVYFDASEVVNKDLEVDKNEWEFGDGTTGSGSYANHAYKKAGTYIAKLTIHYANNTTEAYKRKIVLTNQSPDAMVGFDPSPPYGKAPFTLTCDLSRSSDSNDEIDSYKLDFGDGATTEGEDVDTSVVHTYEETGTYSLSLTVTDTYGSEDEFKEKVRVAKTVSYDDLMRHNEDYVGDFIHLKGEIVQVAGGEDETYVWRVATRENEFSGYSGDVVWVTYRGSRFLERDIVEIYGLVEGLKTYEAVMGNEVTIPNLNSLEVELIKKAGKS